MANEAVRLLLGADGQLRSQADERAWDGDRIDESCIEVPHLVPHVMTFDIGEPKGSDVVKALVRYSCHCWSSKWEDRHSSASFRIMDGNRERAFDPARFEASLELPALIRALPEIQVYVTRTERNYGCYCAARLDDVQEAYTGYFTMRRQKGRFNGIRHTLLLQVESAYPRVQPEQGRSRTSLRAIIAAARKGMTVKYRSP